MSVHFEDDPFNNESWVPGELKVIQKDIPEITTFAIEGDALTGGFLLEVDRYAEDVHFTSRYRQLPINIKSPDSDEIVSVQAQYIEDYINKIEELLYSGETFNPDYKEFLDIDSFVDYWIVNELIYNPDIRIPGSVWMYKDRLGKLCAGPIWDYDIRTFNGSTSWLLYNYETDLSNSSETNRSLWYKRLFEDPEFKALAKLKWEKYKPYFESIPEYIDEQATIISPSVKMTLLQWPDNAGWNTDVKLSWEEAVSLIKENYLKRLEFLNKQIQKF